MVFVRGIPAPEDGIVMGGRVAGTARAGGKADAKPIQRILRMGRRGAAGERSGRSG